MWGEGGFRGRNRQSCNLPHLHAFGGLAGRRMLPKLPLLKNFLIFLRRSPAWLASKPIILFSFSSGPGPVTALVVTGGRGEGGCGGVQGAVTEATSCRAKKRSPSRAERSMGRGTGDQGQTRTMNLFVGFCSRQLTPDNCHTESNLEVAHSHKTKSGYTSCSDFG